MWLLILIASLTESWTICVITLYTFLGGNFLIGLILVERLPFPTTDTTIRLGLRWSKKEKVNRDLAFIVFCFLVIDTE